MAIQIFLQLDGLQGESQKSGAEGWIDTFRFSNGASKPSTVALGSGSDATQTYFQCDLTQDLSDSRTWGSAAGGGKPSESIPMSAKSLWVTYPPRSFDGSLGSKVVTRWNVTTISKI